MEDITLKVIYSLKHNMGKWNDIVADVMSEYSGMPAKDYDERLLNRVMKNIMYDYIDECDKPSIFLYDFMTICSDNPEYSLGHKIARALDLQRVKRDGRYINGFRDLTGDENESKT